MSELFVFEAMGCEIVVRGATETERRAVEDLFAEHDAVFSRFRASSELSRVNASRSTAVEVSPLFARTLATALLMAKATDGLVDPTLGAAIEEAGYVCDFAELQDDPRPAKAGPAGAWPTVQVVGTTVLRPPGIRLDLNGVVKSLAVDDALALLSGSGFVSAGGDLAVHDPLVVGLPEGGTVRVEQGGLATSGSTERTWLRGGVAQHHLIDPITGRPSDSSWTAVTVSGRTCLVADVAAKAAFLLGRLGPSWLDERGLPGRFVGHYGEVLENAAWRSSISAESPQRVGSCI